MQDQYDVVIVGGSSAGLAAANTLARSRRSVLVIDAGDPRNAPAGHVHNYLGRENTPPRELVQIGRSEVTGYGGTVVDGRVSSMSKNDNIFRVTLDDGSAVDARRVLLASGVVDELPDIAGLAPLWGTDVIHCPYCHGWEVRDQPIGILAVNSMALHLTMMFRQLSDDVTVFRHLADDFTDDQYEQLAARDIGVVDGRVIAVESENGRLSGVTLEGGQFVSRSALAIGAPVRARVDYAAGVGIVAETLEMNGTVIGTHVPVDAMGTTKVPGVFAAGNVAVPNATVIASAAAGVSAGAAINIDLIGEETRAAVDARREPVSR